MRAACEGLGIRALSLDGGEEVQARAFVNASTAKRIIEREGFAQVRHIDVNV